MRKNILFIFCLLLSSISFAGNNIITPQFHLGDSIVYETKGTVQSQLKGNPVVINVTSESSYVIGEKIGEDYLLRITLLDSKMESAPQNDMVSKIMNLVGNPLAMLKGSPMELVVDKYGKAKKVRNMASVTRNISSFFDSFWSKLEKEFPQIKVFMSKEAMMSQVMNMMNEETLIKVTSNQIGFPFLLSGKELKNGTEVRYVVSGSTEGIANITNYQSSTIADGAVVTYSGSSVDSHDELLKQTLESPMIKEMMQKMTNEEKEQAKALLKERMKQHVTASSTDYFFKNGYMKKSNYKATVDDKNGKRTLEGIVTCIYHSWK